ncbi:hypothetical protein [Catellatospora sp. NPDC049133]|uniref:Rab family GTPase n=1 Tax=Catellatospora sp. NPDC049133 TaxID=3155499 RepID=UPI0033F7456B
MPTAAATAHPPAWPTTMKIVVVGPPGGGASSLVAAVSDLPVTGPVGREFGRRTLGTTVVYLFTLAQSAWWLVWPGTLIGAHAVIVVVPTSRLPEAYPLLDATAGSGLPYAVVVDRFGDPVRHHPAEIREALATDPSVPVIACDVRDRAAAQAAFTDLVSRLRPHQ